MLFNSFDFLIFLILVFILYWFVFKNQLKQQNILVLISSYVFYGWWDYRFLSLILFSTLLDYLVGHFLGKTIQPKKRKLLLWVSLLFNLGLLGFFKYYNFFIESWVSSWESVGVEMHVSTLQIILPVGISFYTFQTLSYTIDVYKNKIKPTDSFIEFASFVAFFPQLVAGPIERASHLLPQFSRNRVFDYEKAVSGVQLFIWGFFKKVVIADSCAIYVNEIFGKYEQMNSLTLIVGVFLFAFQIYGDFSGYSDMAIGISRLFGFDLMNNFKYPYFAKNIAEFWRRWHISLTTWFRDYIYFPLGGSHGSKINQIRNIFIVFLISGVWHGANWTFVFWGFLNALFFIPIIILTSDSKKSIETIVKSHQTKVKMFFSMILTFSITCIGWIFFRSVTITDAFGYLQRIVDFDSFSVQYLSIERYSLEPLILIMFFIAIEWMNQAYEHPFIGKFVWLKTWIVILLIVLFGVYSNALDFIYFQF
ncbi:MBOAT family O-acyltransferase [Flavobacterium sp.]|uniref:MBOAT family O-acyltransferase n=1 Tax=Flavobacterium sp. TaxID=239 RepID=UPI0037BF40E4